MLQSENVAAKVEDIIACRNRDKFPFYSWKPAAEAIGILGGKLGMADSDRDELIKACGCNITVAASHIIEMAAQVRRASKPDKAIQEQAPQKQELPAKPPTPKANPETTLPVVRQPQKLQELKTMTQQCLDAHNRGKMTKDPDGAGAAQPTPDQAMRNRTAPFLSNARWSTGRLAALADSVLGEHFCLEITHTANTESEVRPRIGYSLFFAGLSVPGLESEFAALRKKFGAPSPAGFAAQALKYRQSQVDAFIAAELRPLTSTEVFQLGLFVFGESEVQKTLQHCAQNSESIAIQLAGRFEAAGSLHVTGWTKCSGERPNGLLQKRVDQWLAQNSK